MFPLREECSRKMEKQYEHSGSAVGTLSEMEPVNLKWSEWRKVEGDEAKEVILQVVVGCWMKKKIH